MRLYLEAKSREQITYIPDWIRVHTCENDQDLEITFDIHGECAYMKYALNSYCKGDLVPWELINKDTGENTNLWDLESEEIDSMFPITRIAKLFEHSDYYEVGVYPVNADDSTLKSAEEDVLTECKGSFEIYCGEETIAKEFIFETELNIW